MIVICASLPGLHDAFKSSKAQACFFCASGFLAMNNHDNDEQMPESGRRWYWHWDSALGFTQRWHTMWRSLELTARAMGLREEPGLPAPAAASQPSTSSSSRKRKGAPEDDAGAN